MCAAEGRHRGADRGGHAGQVRWWRVPPRSPRAAGLLGVGSVVLVTAGLALVALPAPRPGASAPVVAPLIPVADGPSAPVAVDPGPVRATGLVVAALGIDDALVDATVDTAGALVPPVDPAVPAWFAGSAVPGEPGPAVIVGHVDSRSGPGVFHGLAGLDVGSEVGVRRSDGRVVDFRVVEVYEVPKDGFPTERVYGPVPVPELRLITCGGEFDAAAGRYLGDVVVTAVPVTP